MVTDLGRMLDKCQRGQWSIDDLDWSATPRPMRRDEEMAVVQYFTDMAGIERLAGALFAEQRRRTDDPVLAEIFATFVIDEERHACVAERLAAHYDRRRYRRYTKNPHLVRFCPVFIDAIRHLSAEVANVYITMGELLLDIALLRSLSDYVDDDMCRRAMTLINRDESRHIAIDYHMVEYYASPAYRAWHRRQPRTPWIAHARAWAAFARLIYLAGPFIQDIFIQPMRMVDPSGRRMHEAFKRAHMLGQRPDVAARPFSRFMAAMQAAYEDRRVRAVAGPLLIRLAGIPGDAIRNPLTAAEMAAAARMSYDDLAAEALAVKDTDTDKDNPAA